MSFDNSRVTFDPWKDYFGVVMQQGRVQLDSDWNEWQAELDRRFRAGTLDIFGLAGAPSTTPFGFKIKRSESGSTPPAPIVTIDAGRYYVDGILVENHGSRSLAQWDPALAELSGAPQPPGAGEVAIEYTQQPWLPGVSAPPQTGAYLFYLDVWRREVTWLEDSSLVDQAVGIDTTGRYQMVWQVKYKDVSSVANLACSNPGDPWTTLIMPTPSRLTTGVVAVPPGASGPCSLSPAAGYTGLENQLYRVEIHQGGSASPDPPVNPTDPSTATFKFSRDNATVTTAVTAISGGVLTVQSLGRDQVLGFQPGDWIEITVDSLELNGKPGELHQIASIDPTANAITLDSAVTAADIIVSGPTDATRHTRITRWDQAATVYRSDGTVWASVTAGSNGIPLPPSDTTLILENGITVAFDLSGAADLFRTGDFWTFAARVSNGSVETLQEAPPSGIHHHYCRLGIIDYRPSPPTVTDCRQVLPSLVSPCIRVSRVQIEGVALLNDGTASFQSLSSGIQIVCDSLLDPAIITQPAQMNCPICFLTLDVPVESPTGAASGPTGFNPIVIPAVVSVAPSSNAINWAPTQAALAYLDALPSGQPLLAHLTLRGNAIWSKNNPNVYLNGAATFAPATGLQLPSGDGRPFADFAMWFWLVSQPLVVVSPNSIVFNPQSLTTTSVPQIFTVTNSGSNPLSVSTGGDFAIPPANAPVTVPVGTVATPTTVTASITFTPSTLGTVTGAVNITGNADGSTQAIALTGTGIASQLSVDPSNNTLPFPPDQVVGSTSGPLTVTLTNTGGPGTELTISGVTLTDPVNFTVTTPWTGNVKLQNGDQYAIAVVFNPTAIATYNDVQLQITHDVPNTPELVITLTGTGIEGTPKLSYTPNSLFFDPKKAGPTSVQVSNAGTAPLIISKITVDDPGIFQCSTACVGTFAPGAGCTIQVGVISKSGGSSNLNIYHNDPNPALHSDGTLNSPLQIDLEATDSSGILK